MACPLPIGGCGCDVSKEGGARGEKGGGTSLQEMLVTLEVVEWKETLVTLEVVEWKETLVTLEVVE